MGCKSSKLELTDKEKTLLINNTDFDQERIDELYKGFKEECPDGKLRKKYLQSAYQYIYTKGNSTEFSSYVFKALDSENKGYIKFTRFVLALHDLESDLDRKLKLMFKVYDLNRNSQVGLDEMTKLIKAVDDLKDLNKSDDNGLKRAESKAKLIFEKLGKDSKSAKAFLSEQEFVEACLNDQSILSTLLPPN